MFAYGASGAWNVVDQLIPQVHDRLLVGHILAQRYLNVSAYRANSSELLDWLRENGDSPYVDKIRYLADRVIAYERDRDRPRQKVVYKTVKAKNSRRSKLVAYTVTLKPPSWPRIELGRVDSDDPFYSVDDRFVADRSGPAMRSSGVQADWRAALAAWRDGDYVAAESRFADLAGRSDISPWTSSGAAFWAARSALAGRRPADVNRWLTLASQETTTFYGLLARRILNQPMPFSWHAYQINPAALSAVAAIPAGRRGLALLQLGEDDRALDELRLVTDTASQPVLEGVFAIATIADWRELASEAGARLGVVGGAVDPSAYPIPRWRPSDGFRVDRALIYAVIRQESGFRLGATSPAGARGLMQIMPATARFVARTTGHEGGGNDLYDPTTNMELGQRYLEMLLSDGSTGGDLLRVAAAWNAGPGSLERWHQDELAGIDDPLLFMELIGYGETRAFVQRVLANLWVYESRLGYDSPTLDSLAQGGWPVYTPNEQPAVSVARYGGR